MISFPDVNVWMALTVAEHTHHQTAEEWLDNGDGGIVLSRVTQMGLLRLLTNRSVLGRDTFSPVQAWGAFDEFLGNSRISLSEEPPRLEHHWRTSTTQERHGSKWWADTYLSAFAAAAGCILVTFDAQLGAHKNVGTRLLRR
jgi:uncharacterized protein